MFACSQKFQITNTSQDGIIRVFKISISQKGFCGKEDKLLMYNNVLSAQRIAYLKFIYTKIRDIEASIELSHTYCVYKIFRE